MRRTRLNEGWSVRPRRNPFAEMQGGSAEWEPVTLPHDAMIGGERSSDAPAANAYFVGGTWEYRLLLDVAAEPAGPVKVLELEGAYRDAVVLVNGTIAATRPYGYSTFCVPIDHLLRFGAENEIVVQTRAGDDSRWYSGGGLYRDVWLLEAGPIHLVADGLDIRTPEVDEGGAIVVVAAEVRNQNRTTSVAVLHVELVDAAGQVVARAETPVTTFPGETVTARQRLFVARPRRWGPDHPYVYECRVSLTADDTTDRDAATFGIRSLTVDPQRGLRINGEPVLLRGACVHHDNGPLGAATFERAEERRVELLQSAGFNAIRSAHNPMSAAMLRACDRLGMLVMDETFDMWAQQKSDDDYALRFAEWWEADVEAMVRRDVNHPSVVMYSIGNEIPDGSTSAGLHRARAIADKVRSLDDTRFVTQAVTGILVGGPEIFNEFREAVADPEKAAAMGVNTTAMTMADIMDVALSSPIVAEKTAEAFSHLDVAGYNYMDTRFAIDAERYPERIIVATETYASTMAVGWAGVTEHPNVIGDFTWTGWDYLGEVGIGRVEHGDAGSGPGMTAFTGDHPWLAAWCGDIDITGRRRPQSHHREIVFGLTPGPYLAVGRPEHHGLGVVHASPWAWPDVVPSWTWDGHEGQPITVHVYAAADEVELLLDGTSIGRVKVGIDHPFRAELETTYRPGRLEAIAWREGAEVGRASLQTATGEVQLEVRPDRSDLRTDGTDLAFVDLALVDATGTEFVDRDRAITIDVAGPGVLQGFGSADPCTDERFTSSTRTTFDGRALAVIRPTGAGTITVTASIDGCLPTSVELAAGRGPASR